jgi:dTDP-4-amino-4,6-dideoxygalactose transaminase
MTDAPIPFGKPQVDAAETAAIQRVLESGIFVHGKMTHEFEAAFAARAGAQHAVAVASCTAGLHLSVIAAGAKAGDLVAVPAMTHVATSHVLEHCGATPVFVDVEPDSGNVSAAGITAAAGNRSLRGMMVVHYLGLPCAMDEIGALAAKAGAFVIEDCALALDATFDGRKVGNFGLTGCFSFYPIKHMTSVEGGMVTTNDPDIAGVVAQRRSFGYDQTVEKRKVPGVYDVNALGFNYRMSEVEAAVGLAQMAKLDAFQRARAENFRRLQASLADIDELTIFAPKQGKAQSTHYCLNATLPRDGRIPREAVMRELGSRGIGTSVHYPSAVPLFTYYREKYGYRPGQFPNAEWIAAQTISLPVGPHLPPDGPERIGRAVKEAIAAVTKGRAR